MWKLTKIKIMKTLKIISILLLVTFLSSCGKNYIKPNGVKYSFLVQIVNVEDFKGPLGEDVRRTSSSVVACDSFQMITPKECYVWSEGSKMSIKCNGSISIASQ